MYLSGRGWGKNWAGTQAVRYIVAHPWLAGGRHPRFRGDLLFGKGAILGIAGRTHNDVVETMLYGPSGIMTLSPPWDQPRYIPSRRRIEWRNGAIARLIYGDTPKTARGPNLGFVLADEVAHWAKCGETWGNIEYTLRHGERPLAVITSTPTAAPEFLEILFVCENRVPVLARAGEPQVDGYRLRDDVECVQGDSYENAANLAPSFLAKRVKRHEGTPLGDQEIRGRIMLGVVGAPWRAAWFRRLEQAPEGLTKCIAIDPAKTSNPSSSESGIVVMGADADGHLYLLADRSGHYTPAERRHVVASLAAEFRVDDVVREDNALGEALAAELGEIRPRLRQHGVTATQDKATRAALVTALWEDGKVFHVGGGREAVGHERGRTGGEYVEIEHQMTHFDPNKPASQQRTDRFEAAVWAALWLVGDGTDRRAVSHLSNTEAWAKIRAELLRRREMR